MPLPGEGVLEAEGALIASTTRISKCLASPPLSEQSLAESVRAQNTTRTNILTAPFRLVLLLILLCVCLAVWRRRRSRHRMALLPTTTAAKHHPETSTIASGSTNTNTADTIVQPPPAYMRFPHHEPDNHNASPKVAPVGTYAAPQGPPPAI